MSKEYSFPIEVERTGNSLKMGGPVLLDCTTKESESTPGMLNIRLSFPKTPFAVDKGEGMIITRGSGALVQFGVPLQ